MKTAQAPEVLTMAQAADLATQLELMTADLSTPVEFIAHDQNDSNLDSGQPAKSISVDPAFLSADITVRQCRAETARAVARQLDEWGVRLSAVATQIRLRFPKG